MSKVQYVVLAAYHEGCDICENNMVCIGITDSRKEAREIEKEALRDEGVEFVHIYAGDKIKQLKGM